MVDSDGYRDNVGLILLGPNTSVLLCRRLGQNAWQFPQGGMNPGETPIETAYRELKEEIGLDPADVKVIAETKTWLKYDLPRQYLRKQDGMVCIGQKQKWFLLKLISPENKIRINASKWPEFDSWRWVDYWEPLKEVISFKYDVYEQALKEFESSAISA